MSEMIERVVKAIGGAHTCRNCGAYLSAVAPVVCCDRPSWDEPTPEHRARAAIQAMREPTFEMMAAAKAAEDRHSEYTSPETTYRAMIAEALK